MVIISSIVFLSCASLRKCSENLHLPSAYLKPFLRSLNLVLNSVGSSYINFVAVGICQFINPYPAVCVELFYFI